MNKKISNTIIAILITTLVTAPVCSFAESADNTQSGAADENAFAPGEVIVSFEEDVSQDEEKTIIEEAVEEIDTTIESEDVQVTEIDQDSVLVETQQEADTMEMIEQLQEDPEVESVQPNYFYTVDSSYNDPKTRGTWYMDYMDVPEAWSAIETYQSDGTIVNPDQRVKIATLDSGININHEDMADISEGGNFDVAHCITTIAGMDPADQTGIAEYPHNSITHGHSTSSVIGSTSNNGKGVAGIAAGYHNNIAEVMAINVFRNASGFTTEHKATSADICAGIEYACQNDAQVIMMCLGHDASYKDGYGNKIDDVALENAINKATNEYDVVCVASAGNHNDTDAWYPSDFDACISVINTKKYTDIDSKDCKYSSSSYGPKKDISAPGNGVMHASKSGGYTSGTGTSYSAPVVAAIAGLVRYVNPSLTQSEVKNILYTTATDLYTSGYDVYTGWGNVNAYAAVTAAAGKPDKINPGKLATPGIWATSASKSSIKVSWNNVGAGKYYVYRSTNPNSGFSHVKTVTGTTWTNTGRSFNKAYYYKVVPKGTSADGKRIDGAASGVVGAKAICGTPSLKVTAKGKKKAKVSWGKATNASGYKIYRATSANGKYKCIKTIKSSKKGSRTIKKLKSKQTYYYKVRAYIKKNGKKYYGSYSAVKACRQK